MVDVSDNGYISYFIGMMAHMQKVYHVDELFTRGQKKYCQTHLE